MPKFRNFSEDSIKSINLAREETRRLDHSAVDLEQLLIGLIGAGNSATELLVAAGVSLETAQTEVEKVIGRGSGSLFEHLPFTLRAGQAIETAILTAQQQGSVLIEPEHLLLGIVDSGEGVVLRVLENLGASILKLRITILANLQKLPRQPITPEAEAFEAETNLNIAIPPVDKNAPTWLLITTLPQETGRWVAEVNATNLLTNGPSFRSIGYEDSDFKAIAEALDSLARMYRDYDSYS